MGHACAKHLVVRRKEQTKSPSLVEVYSNEINALPLYTYFDIIKRY